MSSPILVCRLKMLLNLRGILLYFYVAFCRSLGTSIRVTPAKRGQRSSRDFHPRATTSGRMGLIAVFHFRPIEKLVIARLRAPPGLEDPFSRRTGGAGQERRPPAVGVFLITGQVAVTTTVAFYGRLWPCLRHFSNRAESSAVISGCSASTLRVSAGSSTRL